MANMFDDTIQAMTYQDWKCLEDEAKHYKRMKYIKSNKRMGMYFRRQRFMGYILIIIGLIAVGVGCSRNWEIMNTLGAIIGVSGLYCLFTKRMIYIDRYYLECQDRLRDII